MNGDELILRHMGKKPRTANEIITRIFEHDVKNNVKRPTFHFYTHLNKRFAPMARLGLIEQVGEKVGPTKRIEKIWSKRV